MQHINELQNYLSKFLFWNKARIACLAQILQALFCVKTVNLMQISSAFQSDANTDSSYRRIRRFFAHFTFDISSIVGFVLHCLPIEQRFLLAIDRTNWKIGKQHINILMLSLYFKGVGIPLVWIICNKGGNSSLEKRCEIMKRVLQKIRHRRIQALLADREFIGGCWFRFLISRKIPFLIRVKKCAKASGISWGEIVPLEKLIGHKNVKNHPVVLWGHYLYVSITTRKNSNDPLIVVSNEAFDDPIKLYRKRWSIETLFGCLKTRGFRLKDTSMVNPERLEKLIFILTIALCWSIKTGEALEKTKPTRVKKHGRKEKSLFRRGFDLIRRAIFSIRRKTDQILRIIRFLEGISYEVC